MTRQEIIAAVASEWEGGDLSPDQLVEILWAILGRLRGPLPKAEPLPEIPPGLDTAAFREAWAGWVQHRRERKPALRFTAARKQLEKCLRFGHERAVAMVNYSTSQGYMGLFEEGNQDRQAESFD